MDCDRGDAFQRDDIFPAASEILEKRTEEEEEIIPECHTRAAVSENPNNDYYQFHGYLLKGNLQDAIKSCHQEFVTIISSLKESLALQLESILENDAFKAISVILDSEFYQFLKTDIVYNEVTVVVISSHLCWQITVTYTFRKKSSKSYTIKSRDTSLNVRPRNAGPISFKLVRN